MGKIVAKKYLNKNENSLPQKLFKMKMKIVEVLKKVFEIKIKIVLKKTIWNKNENIFNQHKHMKVYGDFLQTSSETSFVFSQKVKN